MEGGETSPGRQQGPEQWQRLISLVPRAGPRSHSAGGGEGRTLPPEPGSPLLPAAHCCSFLLWPAWEPAGAAPAPDGEGIRAARALPHCSGRSARPLPPRVTPTLPGRGAQVGESWDPSPTRPSVLSGNTEP